MQSPERTLSIDNVGRLPLPATKTARFLRSNQKDIKIGLNDSFKSEPKSSSIIDVSHGRILLKEIQEMITAAEENCELRMKCTHQIMNKVGEIIMELDYLVNKIFEDLKKKAKILMTNDTLKEKVFLHHLYASNTELSINLDKMLDSYSYVDKNKSTIQEVYQRYVQCYNETFQKLKDFREEFMIHQNSLEKKRFGSFIINKNLLSSIENTIKDLLTSNLKNFLTPIPRSIKLHGKLSSMCYLNNRNEFATSDLAGELSIFGLNYFEAKQSYRFPSPIIQILYDSSHSKIIVSMRNGHLQCWDLGSDEILPCIDVGQNHVTHVENLENNLIACSGGDDQLLIVNTHKNIVEKILEFDEKVGAIAKILKTNNIAVSLFTGDIVIFDMYEQKIVSKINAHLPEWIHHLRYCLESRLLVSASMDGTVKIWEISEDCDINFMAATEKVSALVGDLVVVNKKNLLITANWDRYLRIYDLTKGSLNCSIDVGELDNKYMIYLEDKECIVIGHVPSGVIKFYHLKSFDF